MFVDKSESLPSSTIGLIAKESLPYLKDGWAVSPILRVEPHILAYEYWKQMITQTQMDRREKKISVYWEKGEIQIGPVEGGTRVSNQRSIDERFSFNSFRIAAINPFKEELLDVHTHYKPPQLDHLPTTPLSDTDINNFLGSPKKALVMIDTGGVHILARTPYSTFTLDKDIDKYITPVKKSLDAVKKRSKLVIDVIRQTAKQLQPLGIKYYYSPSLELNKDGVIEVIDVLKDS